MVQDPIVCAPIFRTMSSDKLMRHQAINIEDRNHQALDIDHHTFFNRGDETICHWEEDIYCVYWSYPYTRFITSDCRGYCFIVSGSHMKISAN